MSQNNVNLSVLVESVIADFIKNNVLFTALDVSNKVKETMPFARHREVRDAVRNAWVITIEPNGYGRTPINVNLADGSVVEALLYHPLFDSWDLDTKYDAQKRSQVSSKSNSNNVSVTVNVGTDSVSKTSDGTITVTNMTQTTTTSTPVAPVVSTTTSTPSDQNGVKGLWEQLFKTQPSLFPRQ